MVSLQWALWVVVSLLFLEAFKQSWVWLAGVCKKVFCTVVAAWGDPVCGDPSAISVSGELRVHVKKFPRC